MMNFIPENDPNFLLHGLLFGWMSFVLIPLMLWSLVWKGWALWKAVKNDSKSWFIILLVLNTIGIMDILYIFVFGKTKASKKSK